MRTKKRTHQETSESFLNNSLPAFPSRFSIKSKLLLTKPLSINSTNSFTNTNHNNNNVDRFALSYDEELNEFKQAPKRLALQDSNISRYEKEFIELKLLGVGEFGLVYQCLNRLDGCIYAIKRSVKPVAGSSLE